MLTLWKRHSADCSKKLLAKGIDKSALRFQRKCACACWVTGVHPLTKEYIKQALGTTSWESAEVLKQKLEQRAPDAIDGRRLPIDEALLLWLSEKERTGTASTTMRNYDALKRQILAHAADKGYHSLGQLTEDRVYEMVIGWTGAAVTNAQRLTRLREFFNFAIQRKWIQHNPAMAIDPPKVVRQQADPYSPDEEQKITAMLEMWTGLINSKRGNWSLRPSTFRCLIHVLEDTGLRISDAMRVRPEILEPTVSGVGAKTTMRQMKNDRDVTVFLRPATVKELSEVPRISHRYVFMEECAQEDDRDTFKEHIHTQATTVYDVLQMIGQLAGVPDCRAHRFRHSFAVRKLIGGMALEDVSKLLGHDSIKTTERYYAKWSKARQQRLESLVMQQWTEGGVIPVLRSGAAEEEGQEPAGKKDSTPVN